MKSKTTLRPYLHALTGIAFTLCAAATANAQELITNGNFTDGLTGWSTSTFGGPAGDFGINANGPTDTSAASGDYAYAGGSTYNLLMQDVTVTTGNAYRLTFLAGSKSTQGATGFLSLREVGNPNNYNSASFDYNPSDAVFGSYTVDFVAGTSTIGVWLRSDNSYAAYDNVSVTPIASVANALNYSSASGYSVISSALTGSGKVTVGAGTGGLTLSGANTHTGGTEVTGGTLFVTGAGTLGDASGNVTVSGGGELDLRNQQTRTGTISMTYQDARILSGDPGNPGSIVNNGGAFQFGGGLLNVAVSGSGGMDVTGGGTIDSSNSYTGATTISATTGWYGTDQLFVNNANALGAASGDLTISGGNVNLTGKTITRSGNLTISAGSLENGAISKSGSDYNIQGGSVGAVLAGTAGLTKSGSGNAYLGGANTYSGNTTINGGTLSLYSVGDLGNAAAAVTVNTNATLYTHSGLTISRTGDVTVNGGNLTTDNNNFGTISVSGGNFIANNAAVLAVKLAGTAGLTVGGTGETYLWTDSSYTGATVISSGQLTLGGVGAISSQSSLQIDSGAAVNLTGPYAANNINRTFAGLTGAGVLNGDGGTVTINKASGTDTFSGSVQGAQGLIKDGAGTLILAGTNTYTGATAVNLGTLALGSANTNNEASTVFIAASGATLDLAFAGTDTVDKLFIGGIQQPAGVYEAVGNPGGGIEIPQITSTGTLTVTTGPAGTTYAAWQSANSTTGAIDEDHDNDGVSNGVEYFLMGTANSTGFTALPPVDNTGGTLSVTWTKAAGYSGSYGTDFKVETSTTLTGTWSPETLGGNVSVSGNSYTYTFPAPLGARKFARLVVTGP